MHARPRQSPRRLRPARAGLLVLALLFGQWLGSLHAVTHGAAHGAAHAHSLACDPAHADADAHADAHADADTHIHTDPNAAALTALFDHAPDEPT